MLPMFVELKHNPKGTIAATLGTLESSFKKKNSISALYIEVSKTVQGFVVLILVPPFTCCMANKDALILGTFCSLILDRFYSFEVVRGSVALKSKSGGAHRIEGGIYIRTQEYYTVRTC